MIKFQLNQVCKEAAVEYNCNAKKALLLKLQNETQSVRDMNAVIWAVGKIKITESLPLLEEIYQKTGDENYQYYMCRRELEKAIGYLSDTKLDVMSFQNLKIVSTE